MFRRDEKATYSFKGFEHGGDRFQIKPERPHTGVEAFLIRARIRVRVASLMAREAFAHVARLASFRFRVNGMMFDVGVLLPIKNALGKIVPGKRGGMISGIPAKTISGIKNAFHRARPTVDFILEDIRRTGGKGVARKLKLLLLGGRDRVRGAIDGRPYVRAYALPVSIGVAALCGILLVSSLMTRDLTYYEYSFGGKVLGVVKDEADVYRTVSRPEARETINERVGAAVVLDDDENIEVKKVVNPMPAEVSVDGEDDIISNIATLSDVKIVGRAVRTERNDIGTLASEAEVDKLLGLIRDYWLAGEDLTRYSEVGFTDEVMTDEITTARKNLETADEVFDRIARTSFSAIGVKTVEILNYAEEYEEAPVYIDDDKRYEDYELVLTPGATGLRNVTAERVCVNGEFAEETPTSYDVVRPATATYAVRGTKKLPKSVGSGKFARPAKGGAITSPFGPRWGRMHKGIDIDINYAPVYAAGDGKVVYTGKKGGYGTMILIDHGEGFETLYGHLSRSSVHIGDEVYKGQRIATSGNTGRSTGAHLHFEVRIDGVQRNPLGYL
ncbi:MAG: peptidoglycan DD-metalloendopeptidase family protein [Clostridiales Family XIII bacterium]|jgi:murein DD-endopeptidase MepM/ murein hydrolase activator NlpD|nr:peptidoglycan DD-metalloendopeptidase family protein [Clostridiales Family XIII bacterium]